MIMSSINKSNRVHRVTASGILPIVKYKGGLAIALFENSKNHKHSDLGGGLKEFREKDGSVYIETPIEGAIREAKEESRGILNVNKKELQNQVEIRETFRRFPGESPGYYVCYVYKTGFEHDEFMRRFKYAEKYARRHGRDYCETNNVVFFPLEEVRITFKEFEKKRLEQKCSEYLKKYFFVDTGECEGYEALELLEQLDQSELVDLVNSGNLIKPPDIRTKEKNTFLNSLKTIDDITVPISKRASVIIAKALSSGLI